MLLYDDFDDDTVHKKYKNRLDNELNYIFQQRSEIVYNIEQPPSASHHTICQRLAQVYTYNNNNMLCKKILYSGSGGGGGGAEMYHVV